MLTLLLSHERSGSHLLGEAIKSLSGTKMFDEVCNPHAVPANNYEESFHGFHAAWCRDKIGFLEAPGHKKQMQFNAAYFDHLQAIAGDANAVVDIKYGHIHHFEANWWPIFRRPSLFQSCQVNGIRVLHLHRVNSLEAAVSDEIASQRKIWHSWQTDTGQPPDEKFEVPIEKVINSALLLIEQSRWINEKWLPGVKSMTVTYEQISSDLLDDSTGLRKRIGEFVGGSIESSFLPELKKLGRPLSESVANYNELIKCCRGTALESFY
ncbi:MAG: hypothetical protein APF80_16445 [Alphaproteobacteria bacterium BRH_c36]|nr:MAG: hypothetical protein APF80_16445 [Alphaproteobacteria bacterium BRH_c36]